MGIRKWEVGSGKWEVGSGKWEVGSGKGEWGSGNGTDVNHITRASLIRDLQFPFFVHCFSFFEVNAQNSVSPQRLQLFVLGKNIPLRRALSNFSTK